MISAVKNNLHTPPKIVIDTTPPPRYNNHISRDDVAMKPEGDEDGKVTERIPGKHKRYKRS